MCYRSQPEYAADVRIASDQTSSQASEALSFGRYSASDKFQTHANLSTNANGSLSLSASDISMLPSAGTATMGLGKSASCQKKVPHMSEQSVLPDMWLGRWSLVWTVPDLSCAVNSGLVLLFPIIAHSQLCSCHGLTHTICKWCLPAVLCFVLQVFCGCNACTEQPVVH